MWWSWWYSEKIGCKNQPSVPLWSADNDTTPVVDWALDNIPAMAFKYLNMDDYKSEQILLEQRFKQSRTIPGTRKLHCFIPLSRNKVSTKVYSSSAISKIESHSPGGRPSTWRNKKGFVTCAYNGYWWLACVLQVNEDIDTVSISLLPSSWALTVIQISTHPRHCKYFKWRCFNFCWYKNWIRATHTLWHKEQVELQLKSLN